MSKIAFSTKNEQVERRAAKTGLVYVGLIENWITRHRCRKGFAYRSSMLTTAELQNIKRSDSPIARKQLVTSAIAVTAKKLGNTKSVCRSSYIHPGLLIAAESGKLEKLLQRLPTHAKAELTINETRFLAILPSLKLI